MNGSGPPLLSRIAVTESEAARMLSTSTKTMQRLRNAGAIKFFRLTDKTGKTMYRLAELEKFAKSREATG
jgi:hypothetical protein